MDSKVLPQVIEHFGRDCTGLTLLYCIIRNTPSLSESEAI